MELFPLLQKFLNLHSEYVYYLQVCGFLFGWGYSALVLFCFLTKKKGFCQLKWVVWEE